MTHRLSLAALLVTSTLATTALAGTEVNLQVRPRVENAFLGNFYNQGTQAALAKGEPGANHVVSQRARITLMRAVENVKLQISVQDVRAWGSEGNTLGDFSADAMDVHEAWGQLTVGLFEIRAGRQEFVLDEQRLIGAVNWTQQGRSFDALRIVHAHDNGHSITLFASRIDDGSKRDLGVLRLLGGAAGVDISIPIIAETNSGIVAADRAGAEFTRFTGGLHAKQDGDLFWRVEGYYQGGTHPTLAVADATEPEAQAVAAWMAGARVGYAVNAAFKPTLWVDYLSGDADHTDDTAGAFDTLFATNHAFYGSMDRFLNVPVATGAGGLIDVAFKNAGKIGPGTLKTDLHYFLWAAENAAGQSGPLGAEVDLSYAMALAPQAKLVVGASLFIDQGDFALRAGETKNKTMHDWVFVMLDVNSAL